MSAAVLPLVEDGRKTLTTQASAESQRAHESGTGRQGALPTKKEDVP